MNNLLKTSFLFFITIIFSSQILFAQEMNTDRPDKTESTETVGEDKFQLETGIEYTSYKVDDIGKFKTLTAPTTLIRYGVVKNFELRLSFDFVKTYFTYDDPYSSFSSSSKLSIAAPRFGAKFHIAEGKEFVPDFSVLGSISLPYVGSKNYSTDYFNPEFMLAFSNTITNKFDVGYNLGVEWNNDAEESNFFYSVSLGAQLAPKWGSFFEIYGNIPQGEIDSDQNMDAGLTYLIEKNIQIDAYGGLGLSKSSNDFMLGTGVSVKF